MRRSYCGRKKTLHPEQASVASASKDAVIQSSRIMRALGNVQIGTFRVMKLDRIPRGATGKLQRQALHDEVARWFRPR